MGTSDNKALNQQYLHDTNQPAIMREGGGAPPGAPYIAPAVVANMTALSQFLATDVGAAWALAGELAGGNVALQGIIFGYSGLGLSVAAVGYAAYGGTRALDNYFDGALHETFADSIEMVINMEPGEATPYFGGDGFTVNNTDMMSDICSNWAEYWDDIPVEIDLIAIPPLTVPFA
jgi:hypothetical protein